MYRKWIWICFEISVLVYGSSSKDRSSSSSSSSSSNNAASCSGPCIGCSFDGIAQPISSNELSKFEGDWFEVLRSTKGVDGGRCRTVNVHCSTSTSADLNLTFHAYFQWSNDDTPVESSAQLEFKPSTSKFLYTSDKIVQDGTCLLTLDTDFTSIWIVVVQLIEDEKEKEVFVSVLTRMSEPDDTTWNMINKILGSGTIAPLLADIQLYGSVRDGCSAAVPSVGCPATGIPVKANLDLTKYLGTWYVLYHQDPSLLGKCPSHLFYGSGSALSFYRRNLAIGTTASGTTQYTTSGGPAVLQGDGQLCVTVSALGEGKPMCWYYWVLDTDYENYAVVVTCSTLKFNIPVESAMILGRDVWLSTELYNKAKAALSDSHLVLSGSLPGIDFTKCPRDTCPVSWVTKQHFDPFQFSGDWNEVKTYSLPQISGNPDKLCRTTRYTPTRNNSIFIQQALHGEADIVVIKKESRPLHLLDHDGRYEVTVQSQSGGPEKLHRHFILDTNYSNWAVIMKCQDGQQEDDPVDLTVEVHIRAGDYFDGPLLDEVKSALKTKYNLELAAFQDSSKSNCSGATCTQASQGMKNFKPEEYKGRWFVVRETPNSDATGRCSYQTIQQDGATDEFKFIFTQYDRSSKSYESEVVKMQLSNLTVGNFREIVNGSQEHRRYSVLYTDHKTMALVFFCSGTEERVQVLSRGTTLEVADEVIMLDAIINNYLDSSLLNDVVQGADSCPALTPPSSDSSRAVQVPVLAGVLLLAVFSADQLRWGG